MSTFSKVFVLDKETKEERKVTKHLVERLIDANLMHSVPELHEKIRSLRCSSLESMVIAVIIKAIAEGDATKLDYLLSRLIGKVENKISISNDDPYKDMSLEELTAMKSKLSQKNAVTLHRLSQRAGLDD